MPPLYRMPIFYLVALIAAGMALALGRWPRHPEPVPIPQPPAMVTATPPAPEVIEPEDGILRTAEGLRRKVVVKDLDLVCRDAPVLGRPIGNPLDYFSIWFVYGESPPGRPTMLQIGPREGPPRGWVPVDAVLEWDTRLMARPTRRAGRPLLVIYREESCLRTALEGRTCVEHGQACPIEGQEPEGPESPSDATLGLPILQTRSIPGADGRPQTIFEVASLVWDRARIL
ncbi:MAG: VWA domain-containing protein, partial [Isosphaeraceae bacterium]|nr:VWA domain-containing protein [Isosphaeraceae bacterium]